MFDVLKGPGSGAQGAVNSLKGPLMIYSYESAPLFTHINLTYFPVSKIWAD